ncbi:beta-galactosidase [Vagococcus lutrae]|uniref:Beta-galactosidase n=1 Tax=Vagococcus lutrae TaxID=81947 RepID=A0AAE9XNK0_9ENTE|nr:beta-galactosidase family protein [Vagococcus lutrae]WCG22604.1 beta-galactosidase [Vagococcus lutrae]
MTTFDVTKEFLLDGQPFQIKSGAVHYFRILPAHWEHTLYNLKAMGCNTVETYIPWNIHEPHESVFDFSGRYDIVAFIKQAEDLGLHVIVRPSPFVCAEWEFGGLPGWLLNYPEMIYRSSDSLFLEKVRPFYREVLSRLTPLQVTQGGPILMMQVENEYGSYGNDKEYLSALVTMMREMGVDVPLFTSDGSWDETLRAGSMIEQGILATGNFGSKPKENFDNMQAYFDEHDVEMPLMCMEFWDGWFNRYNEPIIRRDPQEFAETLSEMAKRGSFNFYMFHGGTNFGFMNGCSTRGEKRLPQVTSYDYDAPLTEWGDPTEKYFLAQKVLKDYGEVDTPRYVEKTKGLAKQTGVTSLFDNLSGLSERHCSKYPKGMESFGQHYGYILYRTTIYSKNTQQNALLVGAQDRAHIYVNHQWQKTLYQEDLLEEFELNFEVGSNQVDILIENMGRVNYGPHLQSVKQSKGLTRGLRLDLHFESDWEIYPLPLDDFSQVTFEKDTQSAALPVIGRYHVEVDRQAHTFLDIRELGKGIAVLNGFNLGRYWNVGPVGYLYIPSSLLKETDNELLIFETEKALPTSLSLLDHPVYIETENKDNFKKATAPI